MEFIKTSEFVKRQDEDSRFTHFNGTWKEIENLCEYYFDQRKSGYRDGVCLIPVPAVYMHKEKSGELPKRKQFLMKGPFTENSKLEAIFAPRVKGEESFLQIINHDKKIPCKYVDVVLYYYKVLEEDNDRSTDAEWEIISINGMLEKVENEPIPPMAMARNFLHLKGGTKAEYTANQFAESIIYWSKRC